MKILLTADVENKALWDYYTPEVLDGTDLIISCGDLDPDYLQFLVTMAGCPLLYVRGNHDGKYDRRPPLGCIDIDDKIYNFNGLRILGLGGCMRYHPGPDMYTEEEMRKRVRKLRSRIVLAGGFDLLITHAPAAGYGDLPDLPHQGFKCFNELLNIWKPAYMAYGHVHKEYSGTFIRETKHESGTCLVNAYRSTWLEIGPDEYPGLGQSGSPLYDLYMTMQKRLGHTYV